MALDLAMQKIMLANPDQRLFASQPIYHYLARRYALRIEDMAWEPDDMPNDQQWQQLQLANESFLSDWMLWEKQPLPQIARRLESIGIGIVVFNPCANRPLEGDFLSVMRDKYCQSPEGYQRLGGLV